MLRQDASQSRQMLAHTPHVRACRSDSRETNSLARMKRAQTTSAVGAGLLGAGIALQLPAYLKVYALAVGVLGLLMHAWGMFDNHRLQAVQGEARVWWAELLYWVCWLSLAMLLVYVVVSRAD
jgi:hypothetical protein